MDTTDRITESSRNEIIRLPFPVKAELYNLQLQFGVKTMLTLDDYAQLYGISRRNASTHLRRKQIPFTKEGKELFVSVLDLAIYKAQRKSGPDLARNIGPKEDMSRRRGFSQMAEKHRYGL